MKQLPVIVSLICLCCVHAETIMLLAPDYPPFTPHGGRPGIWCELVSEAYALEGITVQWTVYPIQRGNLMVSRGESLAIVNSEIAFDDTSSVFMPTASFFYVDVGVFFKGSRLPDSFRVDHPGQLSAWRVGGLRGTGSIQVMRTHNVPIEISDTIESMTLKLSVDRLDMMLLGDLTGLDALHTYLPSVHQSYRYASVYQSPINLIFSRTFPDSRRYADFWASGLSKLRSSGRYLEIIGSYYPDGKINPMVLIRP